MRTPDQPEPDQWRSPGAGAPAGGRGGRHGSAHQSAGIASVLPTAQLSSTGVPIASCSWCHGSPTSALKVIRPRDRRRSAACARYAAKEILPLKYFSGGREPSSVMFSAACRSGTGPPSVASRRGSPTAAERRLRLHGGTSHERTVPSTRLLTPMKSATNRGGPLVERLGRPDLTDPSEVKAAIVGHRQRLLLVVGHVDRGDCQAPSGACGSPRAPARGSSRCEVGGGSSSSSIWGLSIQRAREPTRCCCPPRAGRDSDRPGR